MIGPEAGGILSFNIDGLDPHSIAIMLDNFNVFIRSGYHCCHSWFNARKIKGSARASFYFYNTREEVQFFIEKIREIAKLI